jgi:hypothetical protein
MNESINNILWYVKQFLLAIMGVIKAIGWDKLDTFYEALSNAAGKIKNDVAPFEKETVG